MHPACLTVCGSSTGHCRSNGKVQLKDISDEQLEAALPKGTDVLWLQGGPCSAPTSWPWKMEKYLFLSQEYIVQWYCRWFCADHVGENGKIKIRIMVGCPRHIHACHVCFYMFLSRHILGYKLLNLSRSESRYWQKIFKFRYCRKPESWLRWANNMPPLAGCWQLGVVGSQGWRKCSG